MGDDQGMSVANVEKGDHAMESERFVVKSVNADACIVEVQMWIRPDAVEYVNEFQEIWARQNASNNVYLRGWTQAMRQANWDPLTLLKQHEVSVPARANRAVAIAAAIPQDPVGLLTKAYNFVAAAYLQAKIRLLFYGGYVSWGKSLPDTEPHAKSEWDFDHPAEEVYAAIKSWAGMYAGCDAQGNFNVIGRTGTVDVGATV